MDAELTPLGIPSAKKTVYQCKHILMAWNSGLCQSKNDASPAEMLVRYQKDNYTKTGKSRFKNARNLAKKLQVVFTLKFENDEVEGTSQTFELFVLSVEGHSQKSATIPNQNVYTIFGKPFLKYGARETIRT